MPECPELHLASIFINTRCAGLHFGGAVEKSAVSKNAEVPFSCPDYTVSSVSRGKELKVFLSPVSSKYKATHIVFRFGMSGSFTMTPDDEIPKHAHLRFYTKEVPRQVLCFVDPRRFGSWEVNGSWQPERGPCVMQEYEKFRDNVLKNLSDKAFDKPICEAMLNQKYFNGIGNYLRAEILFRLQIPPFVSARTVLEAVKHQNQSSDVSLSKKVKIKKENPDLLQLCHLVPKEVINLGGKGYGTGKTEDYAAFESWLRCYYVSGMKSLRDSNGRTIWFQGNPGPLAPKGGRGGRKPRKSVDAGSRSVKAENTVRKRKLKKEVVKEEQTEDDALKHAVKKRVKKEANGVEKECRLKKEKPQRGKKALEGAEKEKISRRRSYRGAAPKTSTQPRKGKPAPKDAFSEKVRPRRLKSPQTRDSPKPRQRRLRSSGESFA
ncbi:endonuclease 8-like 1 isoform X2 [Spea bombifrons]|uniref:endonuclease 8-like 1 isoform X2 n=1 Tax=Spea bombifrons TaxID=233779 RepID=UPI002349A3D8|nr:endonuclease 8-like 1 isoform X2 [Spea bombifrons]XP_053320729.1 endonuclease 8-like 1 isoform X2 [Spea bombifrons]